MAGVKYRAHRAAQGGLLAQKLNAHGPFWSWMEHIDINALGFIILGMFAATWIIALAIWRVGRIEERWTRSLADPSAR